MVRNLRSSTKTGLRQSIKPGLVSSDIFGRATLDLNFALKKNVGPLVTATRASTGTYVDANGVIQTAAINEPRFDHDPVTGESLGLLIEEARTNLVTYSEQFDNAAWTKDADAGAIAPVVTPNFAEAPDGTNNADRIVFNRGTGTYSLVQQNLGSQSNLTGSVYLKSNTGSNQQVYFRNGFNTGTTVQVTPEWKRFNLTSTESTTWFFTFGSRFGADNSIDILTWGAQLEEGTFPTSYIPTAGAAVTRAADVVSIGGADFSSFYNQTEGTIFTDHRIQGTESSNGRVWKLTTANRLFYRSTGVLETNTATQYLSFPGTVGVDTFTKTAIVIKENDHAGYNSDDGVLRTANSGTTAAATLLCIGCTQSGYQLNGHIKRLAYFPQRLPDAELINLTR